MFSVVAAAYEQVNYGPMQTYQFPALAGTAHAVFTRSGGVSPAPWRSLNMGATVGDNPANVSRNLSLVCEALQISPAQTATCHLVHSKRVLVAVAGQLHKPLKKADALITNEPGLYLTLRFADCVPVLLYDPVAKSVGLAHAGWLGTMENIMSSTIKAMQTHFDSRPADIKVVIGPSIGPCCYEVGQDVREAANKAFSRPAAFFSILNGRMTFDIWQANAHQAYQAGVKQVVISQLCTACRTHAFFSHRAEKGRTGRFGVFLGLPLL